MTPLLVISAAPLMEYLDGLLDGTVPFMVGVTGIACFTSAPASNCSAALRFALLFCAVVLFVLFVLVFSFGVDFWRIGDDMGECFVSESNFSAEPAPSVSSPVEFVFSS